MMILPTKIIYLSTVGDFNDTHTQLYLGALLGHGHEIVAICPNANGLVMAGIEVHSLPKPTVNFWPDLSSRLLLKAILERLKILSIASALLLRNPTGLLLVSEPDTVALSILAWVLFKRRFVIDIREVYYEKARAFPMLFRPIARFGLVLLYSFGGDLAEEVLHVSAERRKLYSLLPKKGVLAFCWPTKNILKYSRCVELIAGDRIELVHAGSLRWTYCGNEILQALEILAAKSVRVRLTVIGGIVGEVDQQLLQGLVKRGYLRVYSRCSQEEVFSICRQSHLGIALYKPVDDGHYNAQPRKLYEYLALGLPVIGSRLPTIEKLLVKAAAGICVPIHDTTEALAAAIESIFRSPNTIRAMSCNALAASVEFRWEQNVESLINVFAEVEHEVL